MTSKDFEYFQREYNRAMERYHFELLYGSQTIIKNMSNKKFDPTKPVQTRDGRAAKILATDLQHFCCGKPYPIAARIPDDIGHERVATYTADGVEISGISGRNDLVNIPEPAQQRTGWINVYESELGDTFHPTRERADNGAKAGRIACVETTIEFVPGETGL